MTIPELIMRQKERQPDNIDKGLIDPVLMQRLQDIFCSGRSYKA